MNTSLLAIIKRIAAEQGESILSDAKRLKPFISDYAKDEPKEDRVAFGRAIELGAYNELKRASPANRASVKAALVPRLQTVTNLDASRCSAAVDLIEAVIYGAASPSQTVYSPKATPAPVQQSPAPSYQQPVAAQPQNYQQPQYYQQPAMQPQYSGSNYIKKRGLAGYIIFSILTLGIYSLYWIYSIAKDVNTMCAGDGKNTGGLLKFIFFSILTFGIYSLAWYYMLADRLQDNAPRYNLAFKESGGAVLLWIILGSFVIIGPFIALYIIIKNTNALADEYNRRI